jgi:hypothetical protein
MSKRMPQVLLVLASFFLFDQMNLLAVSFDVPQNEHDSIFAPESTGIPVTAIITTSKEIQNAVRFNRVDDFYGKQSIISLTQNAVTMTVLKKDTKINIENTIIVKLRI